MRCLDCGQPCGVVQVCALPLGGDTCWVRRVHRDGTEVLAVLNADIATAHPDWDTGKRSINARTAPKDIQHDLQGKEIARGRRRRAT